MKHKKKDILIVQIYVDDIIFGSDMSIMGELKYFFGLQIKQMEEGVFINQAKYWEIYSKDLDLKMERLKTLQWAQQSSLTRMKKVKILQF